MVSASPCFTVGPVPLMIVDRWVDFVVSGASNFTLGAVPNLPWTATASDAEPEEAQAGRVAAVSGGAGTIANIYMDHGSGAVLVDVDGNQLIDLNSGIGVTTVGHAHPAVVAAVSEQVAKLAHTLFTITPHENYVRVAEKLAEITPGDFEKHSILVNSGAEAVENAVKIARRHTGRRAVVVLDHAFHGRTNLTMAMT